VGKLNATGTSWVFLTYLGGSTGGDSASAITVDLKGNAYVTGTAASTDFPTASPLLTSGGVFILELNSAGSSLVYSTRYPASGGAAAIAVDPAGNAYVTGTAVSSDPIPLMVGGHLYAYQTTCAVTCAYVVEVLASGTGWEYSTYLGGSQVTQGAAIAVDNVGNAYVTGQTSSTDFPLVKALQSSRAGSYDAFVTKFASGGASAAFSTYLGGSGGETRGNSIGVDGNGNIYVTGQTRSANFPVLNAAQPSGGGGWDAFVTAIKPDFGGYLYSTYLGGEGDDVAHGIAVATDGTVTVAGSTRSYNFPLMAAIQPTPASPGGVYRSGDGGADWSGPGSSGGATITGIAIDSGNAQNVVAATTVGTYRSTDGGSTWSGSNSGINSDGLAYPFVNSVAADPTQACVFYAGLNSGLWSPFTPPGTYSFNYTNLLVTSTNCGATWSVVPSPGWASVEKVVVAGDGSIWYTALTNGSFGEALCSLPGPNGNASCNVHSSTYAPYTLAASGCYLLLGNSTGRVSLGSGNLFLACAPTFNDTGAAFGEPVTAVAIQRFFSGTYLLAGTKSGQLYQLQEGSGNPWANVATLDGSVNALAVDPSGSLIVYAGTSAGSVYQATDGGATWNPTAFPGSAALWNVKALAASPGVVYAGPAAGEDAFVTQLSPSGAMTFSTFLGGNGADIANGVAAGIPGSIWVAGQTDSSNLPASSGAVQKSRTSAGPGYPNGFIAEITGLNQGPPPALSLAKTHSGNFAQVQNGATYTLTVSNASGAGPTSGTVTVEDTLPTGLSLVSMSGTNWNCSSNSCTRSDALSGGSSYPAITVTVNVANNAPTQVINQASVSGGGSASANASDATTIGTTAQFSDVSSGATYYDAADLMFEYGVTTGCVQSGDPLTRQYCPDDNVTRQEMAAFIVRAVTGTTNPATYNTTPYFNDVTASNNNFFPHIQKLMDLGITTGCSQNPPLYCPTNTIPRWEMAMFMIRARLMLQGATFATSATPYFADVPTDVEGNGMPFPFIQRAYEEHVTNGCGTNPLVYCPDELVTRGQMASFIMRALFNQTTILGPTAPYVAGVSPNAVAAATGSQITVTITGANTNFQTGDAVTVPSGMLTVSNVVVNSAISISATLTVSSTAVAGPQALVVSTGGQNLTLPLAIKVGTY
jgi:uncharacterized repeat protein (TIGR01451 family)